MSECIVWVLRSHARELERISFQCTQQDVIQREHKRPKDLVFQSTIACTSDPRCFAAVGGQALQPLLCMTELLYTQMTSALTLFPSRLFANFVLRDHRPNNCQSRQLEQSAGR